MGGRSVPCIPKPPWTVKPWRLICVFFSSSVCLVALPGNIQILEERKRRKTQQEEYPATQGPPVPVQLTPSETVDKRILHVKGNAANKQAGCGGLLLFKLRLSGSHLLIPLLDQEQTQRAGNAVLP